MTTEYYALTETGWVQVPPRDDGAVPVPPPMIPVVYAGAACRYKHMDAHGDTMRYIKGDACVECAAIRKRRYRAEAKGKVATDD